MRALLILLVACGHHAAAIPDGSQTVDSAATVDGAADGPADADTRALPVLKSTTERCKLLSNLRAGDPTANDVQHRANVLGADLGIPVAVGGKTYFFFGDTIGFAGIWGGGESHPDS